MNGFDKMPQRVATAREEAPSHTEAEVLEAMQEAGVEVIKAPERYAPVPLDYSGIEGGSPDDTEKIFEKIALAEASLWYVPCRRPVARFIRRR